MGTSTDNGSGADENAGRRERGIPREQLESLVEAGMTLERIAAELERSVLTVRRWLARYGLKAAGPQDPAARASPPPPKLPSVLRTCGKHGETEFVMSTDGYFRCRRCRSESLVRRHRRVKEILVAEAGGACMICGYSRYNGALQFHHLDPDKKRLSLAMGGAALGIETLRREAEKCVLLCSNCHAEVQGGVTSLSLH
ncbi:MAG TPA: HNH endonuclease signature motif containing protein [Solirubrobacteraceae bacterium]|jgi:transcription elongation factor Elf1|nr:HNH endonuclease signature motif containing protein [Solirubrobacteraceae bacterium]